MAAGIGPLSGSVRRGSLCNQRAIPVFGSHPFPISLCWDSHFTRRGYDKLAFAATWKRDFETMLQHYDDILSRIADPLTHALDQRGRNFGLAGILGRAELQDIAIVWKRHCLTRAGSEESTAAASDRPMAVL